MTTQTTGQTTLVNLTINGTAVSVPKGTTVYHAATQQGVDLPIFCYQDRMPPFGACRVCLVEVEKMNKLQTSCTLEATEGMVVNTQSHMAVQGREQILEFLLINHPLDCPICDKGGECPLQDQTIEFGPGQSNFYEEKRHFPKHLALGPLLMLDRERCVVCARCTRFGDIIAGDHALEFIERGFKTEVGTPGEKPVESKFIGNTIMICPVGALTSEVYRFRARPWDNQHTETACTLCPVGCNMVLDQRDGEIMRTRSSENKAINDIWMCDKGWFGYEFANYKARLQKPMIRRKGQLELASWEEALTLVAAKLNEAKPSGKVAGWGGNPLTTEENFLFQQLLREGTGSNHLDHRIGMPIFDSQEEMIHSGMSIAIGECESLSCALLLGVDLTEEFPVIWLRLKQGINHGAKVYFSGHYAPENSHLMHGTTLHAPSDNLKAINEVLNKLKEHIHQSQLGITGNGSHPTSSGKTAIFIGNQYLASTNRKQILNLLSEFKKEHSDISINLLEGRGNSYGARLAGMHPEYGPNQQKLQKNGLNALEVLDTAAKDGWDFLYVAGADPAQKMPSKQWKEARAKIGFMVVQDLFLTESARQADVVLPTLCFVEKSGTFINIAHAFQTLQPGKEIPKEIYADSEIFNLIAEKIGLTLIQNPSLKNSTQTTSGSGTEMNSQESESNTAGTSSGLTATFARVLFDRGVRMKHNPHLLEIVKEPKIRINAAEAKKREFSEGSLVRVKANGNSVRGMIQIDNKVAENTVVLPLGFEEIPVYDLAPNLLNGLAVELEKEHIS